MLSVRCTSCSQNNIMTAEDIAAAISHCEAKKFSHYDLACRRCRRPIKVALKVLLEKQPKQKPEGE